MSGYGINRGKEFCQSSFGGIKFNIDVKKELRHHDHYTVAFLKSNCPDFADQYLPYLMNIIKEIDPETVDIFLESYHKIRKFFNEQQILDLLAKNKKEYIFSSKIKKYLLWLETLTVCPFNCDKDLIINTFNKHGDNLIEKVYHHRDLLTNKHADLNAIINILLKLNSYTEGKEYERKLISQDQFFFAQRELSQAPSDQIAGILSLLKIMTQEWRELKPSKQQKPNKNQSLTLKKDNFSFSSMSNLHTPREQVHTMQNSLNSDLHPIIHMKETISLQPPKISLDNIEIPKIDEEEENDIANQTNLFADRDSIEQNLWKSKRRRF